MINAAEKTAENRRFLKNIILTGEQKYARTKTFLYENSRRM